jgi:Tol biopolymer transport system component
LNHGWDHALTQLPRQDPSVHYQFLLTLVVHQQHDFLMFAARLQTHAPASNGNERGCTYMSYDIGKPWKLFLVSSQGDPTEELLHENLGEVDSTWSSDGTQLAFGRQYDTSGETADIRLADLNISQVTVLPGSKGLFSPAWSPDGRHIAAVTIEGSKKLWLYDVRAKKWSEWFTDSE